MPGRHIAVMPTEVLAALECRPGEIIVDGTLGGAGHARMILPRIVPGGLLIGLDQDQAAVRHALQVLGDDPTRVRLSCANFVHLPGLLDRMGIPAVDGILLDLGLSLYQLVGSGRGFSFARPEPLDMRMDLGAATTAAALVDSLTQRQLAELLRRLGEEPHAGPIAAAITRQRRRRPIETSDRLAEIVAAAVPARERHRGRIHPATRTFMALRIAVNDELGVLERFMDAVPKLLRPGGRLCVLTFHSLEDRIVKRAVRRHARPCTCPPDLPRCNCGLQPLLRELTRRALRPGAVEMAANPMARSAKLRAAERV
jgi:16S rRNA (cytosine1402-N4)-methyltransferase